MSQNPESQKIGFKIMAVQETRIVLVLIVLM